MTSEPDIPPLDLRTEIERIDRIRAELHRQRDAPVGWGWKDVSLVAGLGALIFVAGAIFALQVGL